MACDVTPYGLYEVLSWKTSKGEQPTALASSTLSKDGKNCRQLENKALILVLRVVGFRKYLLGKEFQLLTDHLFILVSESKPIPSVAAARIQTWTVSLSAYVYNIQYRKGSSHTNAYAFNLMTVQGQHDNPPPSPEMVYF